MNDKKICVVGLGYIGFPTATLFANNSYKVFGVEKNIETLEVLKSGGIHIDEPGLNEMANKCIINESFRFGNKPELADVFIICVPTPIKYDESNNPDVSYIQSAIEEISPLIRPDNLVILESTSPVGTIDMISSQLEDNGIDTSKIHIAYCPERVLPGNIIHEMIHNDRIVGGINKKSTKQAAILYSSICKGKVFETDAKTAELCKLAENSYRDINIAFANELSLICEKENINVNNLISLTNKHPRVDILKPGIGVGGHCIPIDPWFIVSSYPNYSSLIQNARKVNNAKTEWVISRIIDETKSLNIKKPKIACLGLSYKPDADDMRESPALKILDGLLERGFHVAGVEPHIDIIKDYDIISLKEALGSYDLIAILVAHTLFIDNRDIISAKNVIDFCGAITK